jgi:hypothetical protein
MYAIDTKHVTLHWEAEHLLIAKLIDQNGFQETRVHNKKSIEWLAYRMDSLPCLELNMLKNELFIVEMISRWDA